MITNEIQIILVEDNLDDAALVIRALKKNNLANHLVHLKDGVEDGHEREENKGDIRCGGQSEG